MWSGETQAGERGGAGGEHEGEGGGENDGGVLAFGGGLGSVSSLNGLASVCMEGTRTATGCLEACTGPEEWSVTSPVVGMGHTRRKLFSI